MRTNRTIVVAAIAWLLPGSPLAAPCAGFTDVDTSSAFCASVAWIKNRGITQGCTAPTLYCPSDYVTRLQMAAFLYRLGFQNAILHAGNALGTTARLGTTDDQAVEVIVNNGRAMRYEPDAISPNLVGGSIANSVGAGVRGATIGGGGVPEGDTDPVYSREAPNHVTSNFGTIGGGYANRVGADMLPPTSGAFGTVGGGYANTSRGFTSTVAGGADNLASGLYSTIGGGVLNTATHTGATIPGGYENEASGAYSFAAGRRAKATTHGTFMWGDSTDLDFVPSVDNFFGARATGGVGFTVAVHPVTGASTQYCNYLPGYSGWSCISDREVKENFVAANGEEILDRLVAMPLFSWNFKGSDPRLRMLGPTAQDFKTAFGLSAVDKTIASGNLHGVALAAIQGLNARIAEQARELAALRRIVELLHARQGSDTAERR
jgi:hypothetical protein